MRELREALLHLEESGGRLARWLSVTYIILAVGMVVLILPKMIMFIRGFPSYLASEYRTAFSGSEAAKVTALPTAQDTSADVRIKLAELEEELVRIRNAGAPTRIDKLDSAVKDLRAILLGDPERALTLQRLNAEQLSLVSRVNFLQSQMQWLFGISLTLALGVLATVVSVVKSSFERKKPDRETKSGGDVG